MPLSPVDCLSVVLLHCSGAPSLTSAVCAWRQTAAAGADKRLARAVKMCVFYLKLAVGLSESYVSCVGGALSSLVRLVFTLTRSVVAVRGLGGVSGLRDSAVRKAGT